MDVLFSYFQEEDCNILAVMDIYISKIIQFFLKNVFFWKTDFRVTKIFFFLAVENKNFKCSTLTLLYGRPDSIPRIKMYGADQKLLCF